MGSETLGVKDRNFLGKDSDSVFSQRDEFQVVTPDGMRYGGFKSYAFAFFFAEDKPGSIIREVHRPFGYYISSYECGEVVVSNVYQGESTLRCPHCGAFLKDSKEEWRMLRKGEVCE